MGQPAPNDRDISTEILAPRLPIIGNIKIGGKRAQAVKGSGGSTFQPPTKFDHFVITTLERGDDGNFVRDRRVHQRIGEKPTELDVHLPFATPAENFYAQMVQYAGRTRAYQCDGKNGQDLRTGVASVCMRAQGKECPCKPYGRLTVILDAAPTFGALYVFRTTSWGTVSAIQTELSIFAQQFPTLWGLPLRMKLYPAEVTFKDQRGQEKKSTAFRVALLLRASFEEAARAALEFHQANRLARQEMLALSPGVRRELDNLDRQEAGHIADEFFPGAPPPSDRAGGSLEKLAKINAAISGEPEQQDQERRLAVVDGDFEIEEDVSEFTTEETPSAAVAAPEPQPDPIDVLVAELRGLLDEHGRRISEPHASRLREAVTSRNEPNVRASLDWLKARIDGTRTETEKLQARLEECRRKDLITAEDEQAIAEALRAGDLPVIRIWVHNLDERLAKQAPPPSRTREQTSLLD